MQRMNILIATTITAISFVGSARAEKVIHNFGGGMDGFGASGLVLKAGSLYGTTGAGGTHSQGTVFRLTHNGANWTEKVLHNFSGGPDGAAPGGGVVLDPAGNLYGTTSFAGDSGCGTVFELTRSSSGGWKQHTLYSFGGQGQGDGCTPTGGLAIDSGGNLFGTTLIGGPPGGSNAGTVFELTPSSGGGWTESVLWSFSGQGGPRAGVVFDTTGNIYGTTGNGGAFDSGDVFRLTLVSGVWVGTSIFSFTGGDNGCNPAGGVVFDSAGNLYGTTSRCGADEVGTVFKLTPTVGQWKMSVIHTFTGASDGGIPQTGVVFDKARNLWGTTLYGGLFANGTVFRLIRSGGQWKETPYSFKGGGDGATPGAGVVFGKSSVGSIVAYGTTWSGGSNNLGVVYRIFVK